MYCNLILILAWNYNEPFSSATVLSLVLLPVVCVPSETPQSSPCYSHCALLKSLNNTTPLAADVARGIEFSASPYQISQIPVNISGTRQEFLQNCSLDLEGKLIRIFSSFINNKHIKYKKNVGGPSFKQFSPL